MRSTRGMRTRLTVTAVAAAVVAGGGLATTVTTAAPAEAATGSIRVITHNIAKKPAALRDVLRLADSSASPGPEVIFLQEVCHSMVKDLKKRGPLSFHPRRKNQGDCSDKIIGEVVLLNQKGAAGKDYRYNLVNEKAKGQKYGLACLDFRYAGKGTRACSTHLPAGKGADRDALRLQVTQALVAKVGKWSKANPILVAGDFNTTPDSSNLDSVYAPGGAFRELSQSARKKATTERVGKSTFYKKKIDYVFATAAKTRATGGSAQVRNSPSDHRIYFGAVPLG